MGFYEELTKGLTLPEGFEMSVENNSTASGTEVEMSLEGPPMTDDEKSKLLAFIQEQRQGQDQGQQEPNRPQRQG